MNVNLLNAIEDTALGGNRRLVAFELAYHAERKGIIRIGQTELAAHIGLARRTVNAIFQDFQDQGLLEKVAHGRYRLKPDSFDDLSDAPALRSGAEEELERLKALKGPDEAIYFTADGWPVLQHRR